jgi:hypothetical protein
VHECADYDEALAVADMVSLETGLPRNPSLDVKRQAGSVGKVGGVAKGDLARAKDPKTPAPELLQLAVEHQNTLLQMNLKILKALAKNPSSPLDVLLSFAVVQDASAELLANPVLPLLLMEDPAIFRNWALAAIEKYDAGRLILLFSGDNKAELRRLFFGEIDAQFTELPFTTADITFYEDGIVQDGYHLFPTMAAYQAEFDPSDQVAIMRRRLSSATVKTGNWKRYLP